MFPDELIQILQKYKEEIWLSHIENLNKNFKQTISLLKCLRNYLADKQYDINTSDTLDDSSDCDSLSSDISLLKQQILYFIKLQEATQTNCDFTTEISEELTPPTFEKKVYPYLVADDICPFCNYKMSRHLVHYQRIVNSQLQNEDVMWNRCPACKRLFVLDYDAEEFDFNDTNVVLNEEKYDAIPPIDIYSVIVLSNTLNCSSNHNTDDLIAKIPVLNEDGEISYLKINASYCYDCKRFTILKSDFIAIKDIVMCKVIDETSDYSNNSENEFEFEQRRSILFQYGYNVQTKKNLSEKQRHIILSSIIEAQIMNRRDVINHINTLIERGSKIHSWNNATQKWKEDKQFVSEYKSDSLPEVIFNNIVLKYKTQKSSTLS